MKWWKALTTFLLNCIAYHKKYIHNSGQLSVFVLETGPGLKDHGGWIISQFSGWPSLHISLEGSGWADGEPGLWSACQETRESQLCLLIPLWLLKRQMPSLQICSACKKHQPCHFRSFWWWLLLLIGFSVKGKRSEASSQRDDPEVLHDVFYKLLLYDFIWMEFLRSRTEPL